MLSEILPVDSKLFKHNRVTLAQGVAGYPALWLIVVVVATAVDRFMPLCLLSVVLLLYCAARPLIIKIKGLGVCRLRLKGISAALGRILP
jgi:hypothetical protein